MSAEGLKSRVLVVDDDSAQRRLFRFVLECEGYEVAEAAPGKQTLAAVAASRPDLVLLEVDTPAASGLDICRQLRDDKRTRQVPVIVVAAHTQPGLRAEGLRAGAIDSISTPFSPYRLRARLRAAFQM